MQPENKCIKFKLNKTIEINPKKLEQILDLAPEFKKEFKQEVKYRIRTTDNFLRDISKKFGQKLIKSNEESGLLNRDYYPERPG